MRKTEENSKKTRQTTTMKPKTTTEIKRTRIRGMIVAGERLPQTKPIVMKIWRNSSYYHSA